MSRVTHPSVAGLNIQVLREEIIRIKKENMNYSKSTLQILVSWRTFVLSLNCTIGEILLHNVVPRNKHCRRFLTKYVQMSIVVRIDFVRKKRNQGPSPLIQLW